MYISALVVYNVSCQQVHLKDKETSKMRDHINLINKHVVRVFVIAMAIIVAFVANPGAKASASVINMPASSSSSLSSIPDVSSMIPKAPKVNIPNIPNIPKPNIPKTNVPNVKPAPQTAPNAARAANIVRLTNIKRAQHGLAPVVQRPELNAIAQEWSARNMRENHLYHRPQHWNAYPSYIPAGGENILQAWSDYSDEQLVQLWYDSPGHRKIMLDPRAKSIGVGVSIAPNGKLYAVQNYGR